MSFERGARRKMEASVEDVGGMQKDREEDGRKSQKLQRLVKCDEYEDSQLLGLRVVGAGGRRQERCKTEVGYKSCWGWWWATGAGTRRLLVPSASEGGGKRRNRVEGGCWDRELLKLALCNCSGEKTEGGAKSFCSWWYGTGLGVRRMLVPSAAEVGVKRWARWRMLPESMVAVIGIVQW